LFSVIFVYYVIEKEIFMELWLKTEYEITSADTDMYGRLRLSALVNMLIQSAIKSADQLGFGYEEMNKQKLFWVLSRLTLKIENTAQWNDLLTVETWPKDIEKILYLRDYSVRNNDDQVLARASSGWLAVDRNRKRPSIVQSLNPQRFIELRDKHGLQQIPEKLSAVKGDEEFTVKSTFYDIDLNQHVTTTRYIDWIMDTFPYEFHKSHYPSFLTMNFMKEIRPDSDISIFREKKFENEYLFEGRNIIDESIAFRAKIQFDKY